MKQSPQPCERRAFLGERIRHMANLALIYVDCKSKDYPLSLADDDQAFMGKNQRGFVVVARKPEH